MRMSGRYAPGLYAGVGGGLLLIVVNAFSIPDSLKQASERDRISSQAQLEQTKAEATKKIADAYSQNAITAPNPELIINDYVLNGKPPRIDWKTTVDPTVKVTVYDKYRRCIGYAHRGKLYFINYYQGVCDDQS